MGLVFGGCWSASHTPFNIQVQLDICLFPALCGYDPFWESGSSLFAVVHFSLFAVIRSPSWGSSGVAGPASHTPFNIQVQLGIFVFLALCGYYPCWGWSFSLCAVMTPLGVGGSSLCAGKNAHHMGRNSLRRACAYRMATLG